MNRIYTVMLAGMFGIAQPLFASGHGPVFGLATPTNPKGGWSLDFNLMGRAGRGSGGFQDMVRKGRVRWITKGDPVSQVKFIGKLFAA